MTNSTMSLPQVKICSICLNVNNGEWSSFSPGVSDAIKKEMKIVSEKVIEGRENKNAVFSDGYCNYHTIAMYKSYGKDVSNYVPKSDIPCLVENTPESEKLRQSYMKGLFTPEMIQQANQITQQANNKLTERFQTLAGIKSCFD